LQEIALTLQQEVDQFRLGETLPVEEEIELMEEYQEAAATIEEYENEISEEDAVYNENEHIEETDFFEGEMIEDDPNTESEIPSEFKDENQK
jgi:methyl-accepting chemotaxis protein